VLQQIIRAEDNGRGMDPGLRRRPVREVPGDKCWTGQCAAAYGAERHGSRPVTGRSLAHTSGHLAGTHAFEANVLIFHHQIQQQTLLTAEIADRHRPSRGKAIGIQGDAQAFRRTALIQPRHLRLDVTLQQAHLLQMVEQTTADFRRRRRQRTHQYRLAHSRL
jgi:hypothetical protein